MAGIQAAPELAALLDRERAGLETAYTELLCGLPDSRYAQRPVAEVASWAAESVTAVAEALRTGSAKPLEEHAKAVSRVRLALDFEIHEVVEGLLLLREAALPVVLQHCDSADVESAASRLDSCLRSLLAMFVKRYAEATQRTLQSEKERTVLILRVAESAASSLDLDTVVAAVSNGIASALGAHYCGIFTWHRETATFQPQKASGALHDTTLSSRLDCSLKGDSDPLVAELLSSRRPVVRRSSDDGYVLADLHSSELGRSALVALPLLVAGQEVAMAIAVLLDSGRRPGAEQLRLALGIADTVAPALENAQHYRETRLRLSESESLRGATVALLGMQSLDHVLKLACAQARALTGAAGSAIVLRHPTAGQQWAEADGTADGREEELMAAVASPGQRSLTTKIPLIVRNEELGYLVLCFDTEPSGQRELRLARLFAQEAARAIEHAQFHDQHELLAILEERQRLAHSLHDSVTQSLYGVTMYSEAAARLLESGDTKRTSELLKELSSTSLEALSEARRLVYDLKPPEIAEEGLRVSLASRLAAVEKRAGMETELVAEEEISLPPEVESELFGIATEALNNVIKHASAQRISIHFGPCEAGAALEIRDDGGGFDPEAADFEEGMGLGVMRERAASIGAKLEVRSRPGSGTRVRVELPTASAGKDRNRTEATA